jgi:hypothetical protein
MSTSRNLRLRELFQQRRCDRAARICAALQFRLGPLIGRAAPGCRDFLVRVALARQASSPLCIFRISPCRCHFADMRRCLTSSGSIAPRSAANHHRGAGEDHTRRAAGGFILADILPEAHHFAPTGWRPAPQRRAPQMLNST